jgi:hypothetical protein
MRKIYIVALLLGVIVVAGYIWLRLALRTDKPQPSGVHAGEPITEKAKPVLDIRPRLIERLQELVKKGSDGLYNLSIEKIEPDLLNSTVQVSNVIITPNEAGLAELVKNKKAPDDVFEISAPLLDVQGIGLEDLLNRDVIDLKLILINDPVIKVNRSKRGYNKTDDSSTIYQKLLGQLKSFSVDEIRINNGTLVLNNNKALNPTQFKNVSIHMKDLLIDSTTQYNQNRFLFARFAELNFKNLRLPTKDNLYWVDVASVAVSATNKKISASGISLKSRNSKKEFQKKLKHRKVMYSVSTPSIQISDVNWWKIFNGEGLEADEVNVNNAKATIYLDRSLPVAKKSMNDFPHQLLANLSVPVHIKRLNLNAAAIAYQEYNPLSKNTGTINLTSVNTRITNLTNIKEAINKNSKTGFVTSAVFMRTGRLKTNIQFDLSKLKTGAFTASIEMSALTNETLNHIAEPLGLFSVKKGNLQEASANLVGNNYQASGKVTVLYDDLHITPLKPAGSDTTELKKKHLVSFIANTFLIKDNNPSKGEKPRIEDALYKRTEGSDLFNLLWKTVLVGTLKTIGINEKFATPPDQ